MVSCFNEEAERLKLMETIEDYENAWASGDFLTVESYFADEAKRFHTEPHVWDRKEIKDYYLQRAKQEDTISTKEFKKNVWKKDRDYLDIVIDGNMAYDAFITDRFKALHIWRKQDDGKWKISFDVGVLNYPCE